MIDPTKNFSNFNQPEYETQNPNSPGEEDISAIGRKRLPPHDRPEVDLEKRAKIIVDSSIPERIGVIALQTPGPSKQNPSQEFWQAVFDGKWDLVREMLKCGKADVNAAPPKRSCNKGKSVLLLAADEKQWDLVREMLKQPVSKINSQAVLPLIVQARQEELTYCCIFKYFFQTDVILPDSDHTFYNSLKIKAMQALDKIVASFFDEETLTKDIKIMLTKRAILTELDLLSLKSYPGIDEALNECIAVAIKACAKEKIRRQHNVVKIVSFRQWRWNQDMLQLEEFSKPRITDIRNMIENCLKRFEEDNPQFNFASPEVRQKAIDAISKVKILNQTVVPMALKSGWIFQ